MKHLFICATPLQFITIINLKVTNLVNDDVTLYILDHSHMHEEIYKKAYSSKLFTKVVLLKTTTFNKHWSQKQKITRYIVKAVEYLNHKKITANIVNDEMIYDKFWVSVMDRSSWLIFLSYRKRNSDLQLSFFEDGTASYRLLTVKQNQLDRQLSHLLGFNSVFEEMTELHVYEPNAIKNTLYPYVKVQALPKVVDDKTKRLISDIFSFEFKDLKLLTNKYIFFDSPFSTNEFYIQQNKAIDFFIKKLGNSFQIKLHPNTLLKEEVYGEYMSSVRTPMEMLCMNADVSQNVFISVLSTVGITPKLMFDQEPVVIFLYKIIKLDKMKYIGSELFKFVEDFENTYSDPGRIFIPESMEELEEILERLDSEGIETL